MKWLFLMVTVCGMLWAMGDSRADDKHGWKDVFPKMTGWTQKVGTPVVGKGKEPKDYHQTVKYEWTGGAFKILAITLARDPAFKDKYDPKKLKKADNAPKEVKVGKRTAWLWDLENEAGKDQGKVRTRLVVVLAPDRVLILEARGQGPWEDLTGLAGECDLDKMEKALDNPPKAGS